MPEGMGPPLSGRGHGGGSGHGGSGRDDGLEDIKALRRTKLEAIASSEASIRSLKAQISTQEYIFENMSDSNPGKSGLQTQINGLSHELKEEEEALEELYSEARELANDIKNWRSR